jgi:DNA primase large subunit
MAEDVHSRALGMATETIIARLLHLLEEKKVLSRKDIERVLSEARDSLSRHNTDAANGAIGIIELINEAFQKPSG